MVDLRIRRRENRLSWKKIHWLWHTWCGHNRFLHYISPANSTSRIWDYLHINGIGWYLSCNNRIE